MRTQHLQIDNNKNSIHGLQPVSIKQPQPFRNLNMTEFILASLCFPLHIYLVQILITSDNIVIIYRHFNNGFVILVALKPSLVVCKNR